MWPIRRPVLLLSAILVCTAAALWILYRATGGDQVPDERFVVEPVEPAADLKEEAVEVRDPFRLKRELTAKMNEDVKGDKMEMDRADGKTTDYDVRGAAASLRYDPPAEAVGKLPPNGNPLVSHKFGADPYALVYRDRVYVYATYDQFEYDAAGEVKDNTYGRINKLSVISSDDLMNWTDHGAVHAAGPDGAAKWASQSWAPAAAHKVIDGKDKFFLYFANNASGIGVLAGDSPTGPWVDPIGKPLIARTSPAAQGVTWLFDPAVLVDDDGQAYIYFGGGVPEGKEDMPNTARVMRLGDDMVSVVGEAAVIPAPFMFESAGINKVNGVYYYTYCSNFYSGVRPEGSPPAGEIAYMTSDSPMGPWTYRGTMLSNPGHFFGVGGNNHHAIFRLRDDWYVAYHAQTLSKAMGVPKGYRSTHLNRVFFNDDGTIQPVAADLKGVEQLKPLDPYVRVEAETMAWNAGIAVEPFGTEGGAEAGLAVADIDDGDWTAVSKADFGDGAAAVKASVKSLGAGGAIELRLDGPEGRLIGTLAVPATDGSDRWIETTTAVTGTEGVHDLYLVFRGKAGEKTFLFDWWQFERDA
ncbi:hypothetical protein PACILC2_30750 [Paenibacillus cisolokensis]|uniref:CBM6 domain-containing protein n=1 Tax=Paenibacillus cisolokensis TaxID=1658519 RepID=A0ABQ4N8I9_9BACL|nr:glycoside hydrolase family 43 protein [Paenibacillus cisolokensis]GIQ64507.1 hypothetical protein PACILC2_30750 [Paenibacillus cisolokensis]